METKTWEERREEFAQQAFEFARQAGWSEERCQQVRWEAWERVTEQKRKLDAEQVQSEGFDA
jgi:hypothetical protein